MTATWEPATVRFSLTCIFDMHWYPNWFSYFKSTFRSQGMCNVYKIQKNGWAARGRATCKFDISSLPHDGSTCLTTKTEWQCWEDTAVHSCDNYNFMSDLCRPLCRNRPFCPLYKFGALVKDTCLMIASFIHTSGSVTNHFSFLNHHSCPHQTSNWRL